MPIYEYRCSACGHELEALQKLSEAPLRTCPKCSKEALTKLLSAAGFQLKGSGWYATDFKGSGSKPVAKDARKTDGGDAAPAGAAESKSHGKSENKSESQSESKGSEASAPAAERA